MDEKKNNYNLELSENHITALNLAKDAFKGGDLESADHHFYEALNLVSNTTDLLFIASELIDLKASWWQEKIKSVFQQIESRDTDGADFMIMANMIVNDKLMGGIDKATMLYKRAIELTHSSESLVHIAESIADKDKLFDRKWAHSVYLKAFAEASNTEDFLYIAKSVFSPIFLDDREFAMKSAQKAEEYAKNTYELSQIAEFVVDKKSLNDQAWGSKLLKQIEHESVSLFELKASADALLENNPSAMDFEKARKLYKKAATCAKSAMELRYLAEAIASHELLGDKDFAKEVYHEAIKMTDVKNKLESSGSDLRWIAESICRKDLLNDEEWAKKLLFKAIHAVKERNECYSTLADIAETIFSDLHDIEWAKELYNEAARLNKERYINVSVIYARKNTQKKVKKNCVHSLLHMASSIASDDFLHDPAWALSLLDQGIEYFEEIEFKEKLSKARINIGRG